MEEVAGAGGSRRGSWQLPVHVPVAGTAPGALQTVLCPVLARSPPCSTTNREAQLSSQSHEELTAAEGSCLPALTTEPQEKL